MKSTKSLEYLNAPRGLTYKSNEKKTSLSANVIKGEQEGKQSKKCSLIFSTNEKSVRENTN